MSNPATPADTAKSNPWFISNTLTTIPQGICTIGTIASSIFFTLGLLTTIMGSPLGFSVSSNLIIGTVISGVALLATAIAQRALGNGKLCILASALIPIGLVALICLSGI